MNKTFITYAYFFLLILLSSSCNAKKIKPSIECEIINSDRNEIVFSVHKNKMVDVAIVLRENSDKTVFPAEDKSVPLSSKIYLNELEKYGDNNYLLYYEKNNKLEKIELLIMAHNPNASYFIDVFTTKSARSGSKASKLDTVISFPITILANMPDKQASNVVCRNMTSNSLEISCQNGNGRGRIIVASLNAEAEKPRNGQEYKVGKFADTNCLIGKHSYVVYNSTIMSDLFVKLDNLQQGAYYFAAYEFNGEGKFINYNLKEENRNTRQYTLPVPPPKMKPAKDITQNSFIMNWEPIEDVLRYEISLSKDENFVTVDEFFNNADIGDTNEFPFENLEEGITYYCKVRAIMKNSRPSEYSEVQKVQLKK
ncbi:MAG: fibronectin type III domain-containing protein [Candidatus Kapaibacterium sp.]